MSLSSLKITSNTGRKGLVERSSLIRHSTNQKQETQKQQQYEQKSNSHRSLILITNFSLTFLSLLILIVAQKSGLEFLTLECFPFYFYPIINQILKFALIIEELPLFVLFNGYIYKLSIE